MSKRDAGTARHVLVIDDEPDIRELLELTLLRMGLEVTPVGSVKEALSQLNKGQFDLCLTDMRLPDGEGLQVVKHIQSQGLDIPVAVITAYGSTENAIQALKAGAFDYLSKPIALDQLRTLIKSALNLDQAAPQSSGRSGDASSRFLGSSPALQAVRELIDKLARSNAPVYISGESGSGKERAARMIHEKSQRAPKPFIAVNCGAIPENLMESEFFGYKKGAFTGADQEREGFFQAAHGGTLFLDEVADLPLMMQVKLLRVIQEKKVRKLGSPAEEAIDVRIISATHQSLSQRVDDGKFRQDLYYRLNVIELRMPPLREMRDDVPVIARSVLERVSEQLGMSVPQLSEPAQTALMQYNFPGNVRELENILERALALSNGHVIEEDDLQLTPESASGEDEAFAVGSGDKYPLQDYLDRVEREAILEALEKTRFNRTAAAKMLGITFRSMRYRMERLGIN
ncbi:two-component system response regulator PilR (NtrC family) [Chitinivorax tropicus]|uniref:Two-component system response regulator PilR (NtrC family) n=1 Tax=Chitinivorax tropicus TaxID=714531 RepID=A0A840MSV4_9PROT|nr:sigma-54 dependent transcriptional regulator [Chitinivorax tropicus]MBB5018291.1 two-component system response regulator PilR (NtrC family) [Chitinivorax tropicus]